MTDEYGDHTQAHNYRKKASYYIVYVEAISFKPSLLLVLVAIKHHLIFFHSLQYALLDRLSASILSIHNHQYITLKMKKK